MRFQPVPALLPILQNADSLLSSHHAAIVPLRQLGNGAGIVRRAKRIAHAGQ